MTIIKPDLSPVLHEPVFRVRALRLAISMVAIAVLPMAAAFGQVEETLPSAPASAIDALVSELVQGDECSAVSTGAGLEARLARSVASLSHIRTALSEISISQAYCPELRAAAARQLIVVNRGFNSPTGTELPTSSLSFSDAPPPANLTRSSRTQR